MHGIANSQGHYGQNEKGGGCATKRRPVSGIRWLNLGAHLTELYLPTAPTYKNLLF